LSLPTLTKMEAVMCHQADCRPNNSLIAVSLAGMREMSRCKMRL
jgi:hypothetical protein